MPGRSSGTGSSASYHKRSRHDAYIDTEELDAISPSQSSSPKRVRISGEKQNLFYGQSTLSTYRDISGSYESDVLETMEKATLTLGTDREQSATSQYELMRDMGFEHLQHEDQDDMLATQRLQQRAQQNATVAVDISGENRRAENGIIERVTCVNFMCHSRLECDLGPLLNFIVGENGSGKSAILTAITLCLGAKASTTNRGGSLKNFVKQGEERGFLAVHIKNCGEDAYEHYVYGDSIVVERHFSRTGTSSFKIKAASGKIISTKRADVDDIVEYYYLQVDNPLNVLSQDNARQFLNSSSATLKYNFFIRGVQLEQLDKDYELIKQFLDAHDERLPQLDERVRSLKHNFDEAQKLHKIIQDNQDMRLKKRLYTNQLAWSQVVEQERILQACDKAVTEVVNKTIDAEVLQDTTAQKLEIANGKLERAKEEVSSLKEEEANYKERVERSKEAYENAADVLRQLHTDERDIHSRLKSAADRARDLQTKICDEERRLENANSDGHRQAQVRLTAAKTKLEEINRDMVEIPKTLSQLEQRYTTARRDTERQVADVHRKTENVKAREFRIRGLQQSRGSTSKYEAFDPRMMELISLINRDGRFSHMPIGPLGTNVRVLKPLWAPILEKTFGGSLNGFIVISHSDQQHLSNIIKRLGMTNIPIFIANARSINTAGKEPETHFDTILRILEFDDPLVRDQLIINNYIDQVILVEDRKKAQQVMFNGSAPHNVVACLTQHDKKHGEGLRLTTRGNGNVSTAPVVPALTLKARMKTDVDGQITVQSEFLAQEKEQINALVLRLNELQREEQKWRVEIDAHRRRMSTLQRTAREAGATIQQIEEELDKFDGADGRLRVLQGELDMAMDEKDQFGRQYGEVNLNKNQQSQEVERLKDLLNAERAEHRDFREKIDKALRTMQRVEDLRRVALVEKNDVCDRINQLEQEKAFAERKRDRQAEQVKSFEEQAMKVSPTRVNIPEGETYASVEKKLDALVRQLDIRRRKVGMTDEEASDQVVEAKAAYEKVKRICEVSKGHVMAIKSALCKRLEKWREFQRYISANSRTSFIYLLSERGYRGKLLLDHRNKKLQVQVEPDDTRSTVSGRDTKTLSGGEKSFSSVCLLLSIWEAMGSRMRCLDEFDVFMDNVNRDVSTNMLVDAARRSVGRQYIFITPNAIQGSARHAPDVKVIRLTDPRQRRIDK